MSQALSLVVVEEKATFPVRPSTFAVFSRLFVLGGAWLTNVVV